MFTPQLILCDASTHPNSDPHQGALCLLCMHLLFSLWVPSAHPHGKGALQGSLKMWPQKIFSFGLWIKNSFHWSIIHWWVNLPALPTVLETQIFSCSSESPILLWGVWGYGVGGAGTCSSSQEEQERRAKKRTLIVKALGSASEPAPGAAAPIRLPAAQPGARLRAKEQDEFYEPYLLLGPKAKSQKKKKGGGGDEKKSTILLLSDYKTLKRS